MDRNCAYAVRHVRLTCAAIDIVESSCTPRSRMLLDAMMLHLKIPNPRKTTLNCQYIGYNNQLDWLSNNRLDWPGVNNNLILIIIVFYKA